MAEERESIVARIVEVFLRGNLSILMILVTLAGGIVALLVTPREEEPQIVVPLADVLVQVPGASAEEVEQQVSEKLYSLYRNEVLSQSRIQGLTASNRGFGLFLPGTSLEFDKRNVYFRYTRVDPFFLSTMKLNLIQGRDFSTNILADNDAIIVNQKFMDSLGSDYTLGESLGRASDGFPYNYHVVGVIEDCHFESMRNEIDPLLLYVGKGMAPNRDRFSRIFVRIEAGFLS